MMKVHQTEGGKQIKNTQISFIHTFNEKQEKHEN